MLAAVPWGSGWMIFGAREFLNTDVMLAGVVIGVIGLSHSREVRVSAARAIHRRALGDDDVSTTAATTSAPRHRFRPPPARDLGLKRIGAAGRGRRLRGDRAAARFRRRC
jgi:hypothetical protein